MQSMNIFSGFILYVFLFALGIYILNKSSILFLLYFVVIVTYLRWIGKRKIEIREQIKREIVEKEHLTLDRHNKKLNHLPIWKKAGYLSNTEYLAEKERKIRKKEQDFLLSRSYRKRSRHVSFMKNLRTVDNLLTLTPIEFERWVKSNIFEKEGWRVTETKVTGDGGIDLVLDKKDEHSISQCKRYKNTIGEPLVRDFYGTMISEGVTRGYFVTTGLFSLSALKFAENKPIEIIDRRVIAQKYL